MSGPWKGKQDHVENGTNLQGTRSLQAVCLLCGIAIGYALYKICQRCLSKRQGYERDQQKGKGSCSSCSTKNTSV